MTTPILHTCTYTSIGPSSHYMQQVKLTDDRTYHFVLAPDNDPITSGVSYRYKTHVCLRWAAKMAM